MADDGYVSVAGEGGSLRLARGKPTAIRMARETVRMDIYPSYYDVTARFIFHNTGRARTVRMGFPESGEASNAGPQKSQGFRRFITTVDGQRVRVHRVVTRAE